VSDDGLGEIGGVVSMSNIKSFSSPDDLKDALGEQQYIASGEIATIMYLSQQLGKPLLTEGPAGVGKTELAKAIANASGRELIRHSAMRGLTRPRRCTNGNTPSNCSTPNCCVTSSRRR
jgi:replication-associated recombination protein RarA